jgi:DNA-binding NarL/FixJ family response regulator
MQKKIKVLAAGRPGLMLDGYERLLNNSHYHEVIGKVSDALELCEKYFQFNPDIILCDIYIPGLNGFQVTNELRQRNTGVKVILYADEGTEENIFYAVKAGAKGLIDKNTSLPLLTYTLMAVQREEMYFGDEWNDEKLKCLTEKFENHHCPVYNRKVNLTAAELDLMVLLYEGLPPKKIAEVLHKSKKTIDNQLYHIKKKFNARNMAELFNYFIYLYPHIAKKRPRFNPQKSGI